jgi:hypothetical protein
VQDGLLHGFKVGADLAQLATAGHLWFSNYDSATTLGRAGVAKAMGKRVQAGKTLDLGPFTDAMAAELRATFPSSFIFPMGAVAKPLQPGQTLADWRPTSDHTRTGFNAATIMEFLRHSLTAYDDIAWFLQLGHFMRVSDVEDAFPNLPLHPDVWPYFLCRFFDLGTSSCGPVPRASAPGLTPGSSAVPGLAPGAHSATGMSPALHLFAHLCGDFGAAGMPGTFKIFYADVIVGMARSMHVLTLPMPVYVDDNCLIGPCREEVDSEMIGFQHWARDTCGIKFKESKDRVAATAQLALGFVWDSTTLTRTLEEGKLLSILLGAPLGVWRGERAHPVADAADGGQAAAHHHDPPAGRRMFGDLPVRVGGGAQVAVAASADYPARAAGLQVGPHAPLDELGAGLLLVRELQVCPTCLHRRFQAGAIFGRRVGERLRGVRLLQVRLACGAPVH